MNVFSVAVQCLWFMVGWRILPVLALEEGLPPELPTGGGDLALASPGGFSVTPLAPEGDFATSPSISGVPATSVSPDQADMAAMEPAILPVMATPIVDVPAVDVASEQTEVLPATSLDATVPPVDTSAVAAAPALNGISALPSAPSGFSGTPGGFPVGGGMGGGILDGFSIAATLSGIYDTNVTQSPGQPIAPIEDDFILSLGGNLSYLSKAADWTFGGNYRGSYDSYFNNSDFSGFNQGAGLVANYDGGRFSATMNAGIDFDRGANRYYGSSSFVERTNVSSGLTARYRLSSKTSLQGNIGQSFSTSSGDYDDTDSIDVGASALWKYSPLTEWGPGIRYTRDSGSSQLDRSSLGPTMTVNYKLSKKVAMNSRVGVDFASYEGGGSSDPMLSASIGLNYDASKLWGMNFSLYRDAQADPSFAGAFTEVTALRLGYRRKVRRATMNLGVGYEANTTENPANTAGGGYDRDYFSLDGSLGMAVLSNTSFASLFMRYNDQSGSSTDSWDSLQTGFSISRSF